VSVAGQTINFGAGLDFWVHRATSGQLSVKGVVPRLTVRIMCKNPQPPICPKCHKPVHFLIAGTGLKFQCVNCDDVDPIQLSDIQALIASELQPPKAL
jgi:hypothetical protein